MGLLLVALLAVALEVKVCNRNQKFGALSEVPASNVGTVENINTQ